MSGNRVVLLTPRQHEILLHVLRGWLTHWENGVEVAALRKEVELAPEEPANTGMPVQQVDPKDDPSKKECCNVDDGTAVALCPSCGWYACGHCANAYGVCCFCKSLRKRPEVS